MKTIHLFFLYTLLIISFATSAQNKPEIIVKHADYVDSKQSEIPDAILLMGNIETEHDGILINCNKAYFFKTENYLKLFGNVKMNQGDSIFMNSRYAEYNGQNGFAYATGDVKLQSPQSILETDTLRFDRNQNIAFYNSFGKITNEKNVLTSKAGKYIVDEKKFQFTNAVTIVTDTGTVVKSNHLDFYEVPQHAYVFGPSTITDKDNYIYTENGYYDMKNDVGKMIKNTHIIYDSRRIEGDSIYYDKKLEFSSATNNVKITDTINKIIMKGNYGEVYKAKDSMFITKKALVTSVAENDSVYIHAKRILVTGKPEERTIRAYRNTRIYKKDMSGKSDSLHWDQKIGLTQMIGTPVVWSEKSQLTGEVIHLINDTVTEKLDSIKVLNNAFIIQRDTLGTGYNQVKGQNLYGKFRDNKLYEADLIKNTEIIHYLYTESNEFVGINKGICSQINLILENNNIETATLLINPTSEIYQESDLPESEKKLRDFIWRGDEQINSLEEIFSDEELELEKTTQEDIKIQKKGAEVPMEIQPETLSDFKKEKNNTEKKTK